MRKREYLYILFVLAGILTFAFGRWFLPHPIIGGDWPYIWPQTLREMAALPSAWSRTQGGGLGGISPAYFLVAYNYFSAVISIVFGIDWVIVYKIIWFAFPVVMLAYGGYSLMVLLVPVSTFWMKALAAIIISSNTYVLMISGGGQMGVFWAVSLFPWILYTYFQFLHAIKHRVSIPLRDVWVRIVLLGITFGIEVSLDPRIAYLSAISMALLYVLQEHSVSLLYKRVLYGAAAGSISILLNLYWVLPLLILKQNTLDSLGSAYTTVDALRFFSFADFSHALSLLHPNWPENIFGKVYFLQPEFLLLPVFAFSSLFFVKKFKEYKNIIGFVTLGLFGAFLAKGANEPFGFVYVWAFEHIPGFVMFRDPSKFYVLIMSAYAILIPISLFELTNKLNRKLTIVLPTVFLVFWIMLIRPAVLGQLGGTFAERKVSQEYVTMTNWLSQEKGFFRTLWVPRQHRLAYTSTMQNPIEAEPLLTATDSASVLNQFTSENIQEHLSFLGIRYVIVPTDPYGELFLADRKYSDEKRNSIIHALDMIPYLHKIQKDGIVVYEAPNANDLFWMQNGSVTKWQRISDDQYVVEVSASQSAKLYMSQSYNAGWKVLIQDHVISSQPEAYGIMSFLIPNDARLITVEFVYRKWFIVGRMILFIVLCLSFVYGMRHLLVYSRKLTYNDKNKVRK